MTSVVLHPVACVHSTQHGFVMHPQILRNRIATEKKAAVEKTHVLCFLWFLATHIDVTINPASQPSTQFSVHWL